MPVYKCTCGAKYNFPSSATGRTVRCKKCNKKFTLPKEQEEITPLDLAPMEDTATYAPQFESSPDNQNAPPLPPEKYPDIKGYAQNVLWTFLFLSKPSNLVTFLLLWFLFSIAPFFPCFILPIFLALWFAAFRFEVILSAAAGDDDIPDVGYSGDYLNEFLIPGFKWVFSWIFVMIPLLVYLITNMIKGSISVQIIVPIIMGSGLSSLLQMGSDPWIPTLVILGLIAWPISVLCITLGDIFTLLRIDLMFLTVCKSFHGYILTLCFLACIVALEWTFGSAIAMSSKRITGTGGSFIDSLIERIVLVGMNLYFDIVVLRLIGLYYRHFKNKFAWNWG